MIYTYDFWQAALAGQKPEMNADNPHPGFYRTRRKNKAGQISYLPVAYFVRDNELICFVGDDEVPLERGQEIWTYTGQHPVTEEAYRAVAERGENWPDIDAVVASQSTQLSNNPPTDPAELLKEQIESAAAGIGDYAVIDSDAIRDRAQSLRSRLLELRLAADKEKDTAKRPHIEAGKQIEAKWKPLIEAAKSAADTIATAMGLWEDKKRKAAAEARAAAEAASRKAAAEAEAAARKAAEEGRPAPIAAPIPVAAPIPQVAPAPIRGGYGRAASVKVKPVATVVDYLAAVAYLIEQPDIRAAIDKTAQRLVDDGHTVPGVTVEEKAKIK